MSLRNSFAFGKVKRKEGRENGKRARAVGNVECLVLN